MPIELQHDEWAPKGKIDSLLNLVKYCLDSSKYMTLSEKRYAFWTVFALVFLSVLDLIGIILLGTVATLTFNIVTGDDSPTRFELLLQDHLPLSLDRISLLGAISAVAVTLLLLRTILQAFFTFKFGLYLASIESRISSRLFELMIKSDIKVLQSNKFSDYQYALLVGSNRFTTGVIGSIVYFTSDLLAALLMAGLAFYASPASTLAAMLIFTFAYFMFNGPINRRANLFGETARRTYLATTENIMESLQGIRDIRIYQKEDLYIDKFHSQKYEQSITHQKTLWLNGLIRYILEIAILLAGTLAAAVLILTTDVKHAITVVTILIVIGFRLIPNIQRLQNSLNSLRLSRASTADLFSFIDVFEGQTSKDYPDFEKVNFTELEVRNLSYSYGNHEVLRDINLVIPQFSTVLLVGESGSGKSTLLDLISGLTSPTLGKIEFKFTTHGKAETAARFPLSYITQDCALLGSTLFENISLEESTRMNNSTVLSKIVSSLNLEKLMLRGDKSVVSDDIRSDKSNISGGERQRVSIARAMYFDRDIILMDEPTSALDRENLEKVLEFVQKSKGNKTILISTHSDDLLELADYVLELSDGNQIFFGTPKQFLESRNNFG